MNMSDQLTGSDLRAAIEDFLYAEAALLDEWRLDEWLELLTDDALYEVPSTDYPAGKPDGALMLIADTRSMISSRVKRLNSRKAYREFPWSRTRRIVGNVRVLESNETPAGRELVVTANFIVYRVRRETHAYVGRYRYRLLLANDTIRISYRRAELDLETLDEHGTLSIIL
jgi:p-cumate 2,3-dioxygenase beta subunit